MQGNRTVELGDRYVYVGVERRLMMEKEAGVQRVADADEVVQSRCDAVQTRWCRGVGANEVVQRILCVCLNVRRVVLVSVHKNWLKRSTKSTKTISSK